MRYEGGRFTAVTLSLFHAAGMLLPVILAVVYMLAYRSGNRSVFYRIFSFFALLMPVGSILGWVVVRGALPAGGSPRDGRRGESLSRVPASAPGLSSAGPPLLFAGCLLLAWRKKIRKTTGWRPKGMRREVFLPRPRSHSSQKLRGLISVPQKRLPLAAWGNLCYNGSITESGEEWMWENCLTGWNSWSPGWRSMRSFCLKSSGL